MEPVRAVCGFLRPLIHFLAVAWMLKAKFNYSRSFQIIPMASKFLTAFCNSALLWISEEKSSISNVRGCPSRFVLLHHRACLCGMGPILDPHGVQPRGAARSPSRGKEAWRGNYPFGLGFGQGCEVSSFSLCKFFFRCCCVIGERRVQNILLET